MNIIYSQYSTVKPLAADPNRISVPEIEIKINRLEAKKAKLRAENEAMKTWNTFHAHGGRL